MIADRVLVDVPNPGGPIGVGSTITLGAARSGYRSFLTAFGAAAACYLVLSDGATRTLTAVATVNAGSPETLTITEVLWNDRTNSVASETFASACVAWNAMPAVETLLWRSQPRVLDRRVFATTTTTVDIALSGGFSSYQLRGHSLVRGTNGLQISAVISRDNLATVDTGASDYALTYRFESDTVVAAAVLTTGIIFTDTLLANVQASFDVTIRPGTASLGFNLSGSSSFLNAAGSRIALGTIGAQRLVGGRATHIRIAGVNMAAGGTITLIGTP